MEKYFEILSQCPLFQGVVLLCTVQVVQEDYYGNRSVMTVLQPGESFA